VRLRQLIAVGTLQFELRHGRCRQWLSRFTPVRQIPISTTASRGRCTHRRGCQPVLWKCSCVAGHIIGTCGGWWHQEWLVAP